MPTPFTTIVPPSFEAASETYQYAPAVRIGDQILISGIVGADAEGRLPPDFRSQAENVFTTLEAILREAGATLDDVASLNSYHVGDLGSQLRELVDIKATRIRPPHPAWTGVGMTLIGGLQGRSPTSKQPVASKGCKGFGKYKSPAYSEAIASSTSRPSTS
jgi:enamine deaminase RidA (YjgF/YER057c/UK114 family)